MLLLVNQNKSASPVEPRGTAFKEISVLSENYGQLENNLNWLRVK